MLTDISPASILKHPLNTSAGVQEYSTTNGLDESRIETDPSQSVIIESWDSFSEQMHKTLAMENCSKRIFKLPKRNPRVWAANHIVAARQIYGSNYFRDPNYINMGVVR